MMATELEAEARELFESTLKKLHARILVSDRWWLSHDKTKHHGYRPHLCTAQVVARKLNYMA